VRVPARQPFYRSSSTEPRREWIVSIGRAAPVAGTLSGCSNSRTRGCYCRRGSLTGRKLPIRHHSRRLPKSRGISCELARQL
ncbi:hypothetical protein PFISCL1PPCAC_16376, partial [Pristionchus fissidentatus]